jgi:molybdate/tungstate transport system substrate-binding protein
LTKQVGFVLIFILALTILAAGFMACAGAPEKTKVRVLCAGSLMVPLNELEGAFEAAHPDIDILTEGHGSIQVIRHVTELHEETDVLAVADHSLIPMMMYGARIPDTGETYADWYIKFAANTLGIAYTSASRYAAEINESNWYEVLARPDIKLGMADARLDSCGYRALMLLYLAGLYYGDDAIFESVLGRFDPPLELSAAGAAATITVPEIMRPEGDRVVVRGNSIRLLALLESGDIDYSFEYRSVAEQHDLDFLPLPPEINLGSAGLADAYGQVRCRMDFQRFASLQPEFTGEPIIYGITIPRNAPHPDAAREYISFLLGEPGQAIFASSHHPMIPPEADHPENLPPALRTLLEGS